MAGNRSVPGWLMVRAELSIVEVGSSRVVPCVVEGESSEGSTLRVSFGDAQQVTGEGYDFEGALQLLRSRLEQRGLLLLCNRLRRNAFVSSLSRQMSGGLSCYLVEPRTALDPEKLVECLGAAERSDVVTSAESESFLAGWKAWFERPAPIRWVSKLIGR